MRMEVVTAWWFLLLAAALPVSIAVSSLLYFPLLSLYILLGHWTFRRWPPQWGWVETAFVTFWLISVLSALWGANPWFSRTRLGKDLYFLILVLLTAYLAPGQVAVGDPYGQPLHLESVRARDKRGAQLSKVFMMSAVLTA